MVKPTPNEQRPVRGRRPPRVLIENADPAMVWAAERLLQRAGYDTLACPGPDGPRNTFPNGSCVLVERGDCPLARDVDVIVFGLSLSVPRERNVLEALRSRVAGTPVCVDAAPPEVARNAELVQGCTIVPFPDPGRGLASAVRHALGGRRATRRGGLDA